MSTISTTKAPSNPLLARYLAALAANPLKTKMLTSGFLAALAEVLAGRFAGVKPTKKVNDASASASNGFGLLNSLEAVGINERAIKMAVYGFAISAPLGHVMTGILQRAFAGKTTTKDKILQIITSNLTVSVIGNTVYLICMAYINGAKSVDQIAKAVKASWLPIMRITWILSPILLGTAQNFLAPELWEPFFTFSRFILSTYFNTVAKKKQMALARAEAAKGRKGVVDSDLAKGAAQGK